MISECKSLKFKTKRTSINLFILYLFILSLLGIDSYIFYWKEQSSQNNQSTCGTHPPTSPHTPLKYDRIFLFFFKEKFFTAIQKKAS